MRLLLYIPVLGILLSACAQPQRAQLPVPKQVIPEQVNTEAEAIAVVLEDIQRRGGDPQREECSARKLDGEWSVMAWHIFYPRNVGSSRFVPGGFTMYVVSMDGKILRTLPGR